MNKGSYFKSEMFLKNQQRSPQLLVFVVKQMKHSYASDKTNDLKSINFYCLFHYLLF